ncbi:MAG: sterol desaturase family protein [Victivallaceae bacterium]|nr:sterol desaturase family protein [Victivallaceae bacterium]
MNGILNRYWFWLLATGLFCWLLETVFAWRKSQHILRPQLWQDMVFLFINGHGFSLLLAYLSYWSIKSVVNFSGWLTLPDPHAIKIISDLSLPVQFVIFFIAKDLLEWLVHNLLHRVNFLWNIHKLHHSIMTMDWIGNFRFHYLEIIVYRSLTWLPLIILGVDQRVILPMAIITTLIGNLNHSNIRISWGPLVYIINSSRMHIWHHDKICHKKYGQNFAIVFSLWDWLFGTAWYPDDIEQPKALGFHDMNRFPLKNPLLYLLYPLVDYKNKDNIK